MKKSIKTFLAFTAAIAFVLFLSLFAPRARGAIPFGPTTNLVLGAFVSTNGSNAYSITGTNFQMFGGGNGLAVFTDVATVGNTNSLTNSIIAKLFLSKDAVNWITTAIVTNTVTFTNAVTNAFHAYYLIPKTTVDSASWGTFVFTIVTDGTNSAVCNVTTSQFP
jgi:hypothetical protein